MGKHETKYCPRCNGTFECRVGDIMRCQCTEVTISEETRKFLSKTEYGCLCKKCLSDLDHLVELSQHHPFPRQYQLMVEDLHYYIEDGKIVMTEFYHLLRGKCCRNKCRHCAYGYGNRLNIER